MAYLPDYHISIAEMINEMNHDCTETIVKKIIQIMVQDIDNN